MFDKDNNDIDCNVLKQGYVSISPLHDEQINIKYIDSTRNTWNTDY